MWRAARFSSRTLAVLAAAPIVVVVVAAGLASCRRAIPAPLREPSSSSVAAADVTGSGTSSAAVGATDQSNDSYDLERAMEIRRALVKDDTLSVAAHNLTVVVHDDVVTLSGLVENGVERATAVQAVKQAAPGYRIDDRIKARR